MEKRYLNKERELMGKFITQMNDLYLLRRYADVYNFYGYFNVRTLGWHLYCSDWALMTDKKVLIRVNLFLKHFPVECSLTLIHSVTVKILRERENKNNFFN